MVPPSHGSMRQVFLRSAGISRFGQDRSSPVFAHQKLVCDPGHSLNIKSEGAQSAENFRRRSGSVLLFALVATDCGLPRFSSGSYTKDCFTLLSHIDAAHVQRE